MIGILESKNCENKRQLRTHMRTYQQIKVTQRTYFQFWCQGASMFESKYLRNNGIRFTGCESRTYINVGRCEIS